MLASYDKMDTDESAQPLDEIQGILDEAKKIPGGDAGVDDMYASLLIYINLIYIRVGKLLKSLKGAVKQNKN